MAKNHAKFVILKSHFSSSLKPTSLARFFQSVNESYGSLSQCILKNTIFFAFLSSPSFERFSPWCKHQSSIGPFVSYEENIVLLIRTQGPHSTPPPPLDCPHNLCMGPVSQRVRPLQAFLAQLYITLQVNRPKENIVLLIRPQGPYSQHFIFLITYEWAQ